MAKIRKQVREKFYTGPPVLELQQQQDLGTCIHSDVKMASDKIEDKASCGNADDDEDDGGSWCRWQKQQHSSPSCWLHYRFCCGGLLDAVALVMQVAKEHHGQQRDWNGCIVACYTPMLIC
eukprot:s5402_g3.t1